MEPMAENARMAARDAPQPKEARTMNEQNNTDALERIVDLHGQRSTLDMLANICAEKAEHLRTNWQNEEAAKDWNRAYALMLRTHDALSK
jgi:hypothetical protein